MSGKETTKKQTPKGNNVWTGTQARGNKAAKQNQIWRLGSTKVPKPVFKGG